ncbi:N-acetylmuramoyl-L-alanine amidase [Bacillus carboniphilus]|uniref:N-acetylmuramoyl-L-alanine amidase n=1 Tax=Bacillus carboniphilus TaxID=86663 RepID=A0ABY9JQI9_9BACI|nr:N-acetylmuramoyl-L-alanine amidase [Bacillus carboniphilus]WLR41664.1 N-acetylmuramoyl-L-alanine amidase [Bacillus carboniphilus]
MIKIVLDAGHGMHTPGKRVPDGTMREWEFNSKVVQKTIRKLKEYQDVMILRVDDHTGEKDIPLVERTNKANSFAANCYVSVHANAYGRGFTNPSGIETYIYPSRPKEALSLASLVQKNLVHETGRRNRGVKAANFHVLRETKMTAILCECGFMTNKEESQLLKSDQYRQKCADAIAQGIASQYKLKKKRNIKELNISSKLYKVQVGAFKEKNNAERHVRSLKAKGIDAFIIQE